MGPVLPRCGARGVRAVPRPLRHAGLALLQPRDDRPALASCDGAAGPAGPLALPGVPGSARVPRPLRADGTRCNDVAVPGLRLARDPALLQASVPPGDPPSRTDPDRIGVLATRAVLDLRPCAGARCADPRGHRSGVP